MKIVYVVIGWTSDSQWFEEAEFSRKDDAISFIGKQLKRTKDNSSARTWPGKYYRYHIREDYIHSYE